MSWLNVVAERKRKRVVDNEIPQGIISLGYFFYLSLFVKYMHPTTVAPNIDIVATKGSCAMAKHNPMPPTVTPLAIMVFLFIYFTFFSNLSHTVLY